MKILYADTTQRFIKIILFIDGKKIEKLKNSMYHSVYILDAIDDILSDNNIDIKDIDIFAVNKGPGSFTGTRVGILTIMSFAKTLKKPFYYIDKNEDEDNIPCIIQKKKSSKKTQALYNAKSYFEKDDY